MNLLSKSQQRCWRLLLLASMAAAVSSVVAEEEFSLVWFQVMRNRSVEASATVQRDPPAIQVKWFGDTNATEYTIWRKGVQESAWGYKETLSGASTTYVDREVELGGAYEYKILKQTDGKYEGYGYLCVGVEYQPPDYRGRIILIVERAAGSALAPELFRLEQDLVGDGWAVVRHDVSRSDPVTQVKKVIQAEYAKSPEDTEAVLLFGHVPVPYSGNITPDDHPYNHQGAWPADLYYGDMDGTWTDSTVNNKTAERQVNWNVPGDGKFDQSQPPSEVELQVGRVDLSNMTAFANKEVARSEVDLLRQYLNKNHSFRHGEFEVERKAILADHLGDKGEDPVSGTAWRNFAALVGPENVTPVWGTNYYNHVKTNSYLWSYISGGGYYYRSNPLGSADEMATNEVRVVFHMALGSYFGDWNNESNFLRSLIGASPYGLAACWAGFPPWYFQHMGIGQTLGFGARLTQNNEVGGLYPPFGQGTHEVHIALMGDPTLRLHPVAPPGALEGVLENGTLTLRWNAARDETLEGYHVYRASTWTGPYERLTPIPIRETSWVDPNPLTTGTYMVRSVKVETSASGSYFNQSQGAFFSLTPWAPWRVRVAASSTTRVELQWLDISDSEAGFVVERREASGGGWEQVAALPADASQYVDSGLTAGSGYTYRVRAFNSWGDSSNSNEAQATTTAVAFVKEDLATQGNWKGSYGSEGFWVAMKSPRMPEGLSWSLTGQAEYTWSDTTTEPRALEKPENAVDRIASCWYAEESFEVALQFADSQVHRLAMYFLDWDRVGRIQTVELLDPLSREVLDKRRMTDFGNGRYLIWDFQGRILLRFRREAGPNAVLMGMFFDRNTIVPAPTFAPEDTRFEEPMFISITAPTAEAVIRYTLDGSDPGSESPLYTKPFLLTHSATIRAKAFSGTGESVIVEKKYVFAASAVFLRRDDVTGGDWPGRYGRQGHVVIGHATNVPGSVAIAPRDHRHAVWEKETSDARALLKAPAQTERTAQCWFARPTFTMDVFASDGKYHDIALYKIDWDRVGRQETIEVRDGDSGLLLAPPVTLSDFSHGTYSVWRIRGHVQFRFSRTGNGLDTVLSGIFLDAADSERSAPVLSKDQVSWSNGRFAMTVKGSAGQTVILEASTNLLEWTAISTNVLESEVVQLLGPEHDGTHCFFRAKLK